MTYFVIPTTSTTSNFITSQDTINLQVATNIIIGFRALHQDSSPKFELLPRNSSSDLNRPLLTTIARPKKKRVETSSITPKIVGRDYCHDTHHPTSDFVYRTIATTFRIGGGTLRRNLYRHFPGHSHGPFSRLDGWETNRSFNPSGYRF